MVLLVPKTSAPAVSPRPRTVRARTAKAARPLAVPNSRLLKRLDPEIVGFVRENPKIESIITREIVRDVDSRVLDVNRLLKKSGIRMSFELGNTGHILRLKIDKSSGVPSIDHLALELVKLLDKYQMLGVATGVRRIVVSINIDRQIDVTIDGEVDESADPESVRRRVQNTLTLIRFALAKNETAFMLKDIFVTAKNHLVTISKSFEKEPLVGFLTRYYQAEPLK